MSETQFGFRSAVFSIQVLFQRCRDVNCDVYACFVDYMKAFDQVRHTKVLQKTSLDGKDLRIIGNLYWNQRACVRVDRDTNITWCKAGMRAVSCNFQSVLGMYL